MVVGRMPNGQQLVVGAGDGGVMPGESAYGDGKHDGSFYGGASQYGENMPGQGVESYGAHAAAPPTYSSGVGEPLGSTLQGQNVREKR